MRFGDAMKEPIWEVSVGNMPDHAVHFHRYRGPVGTWACLEISSPCPWSQRLGLQTKAPRSATARWGACWDVLHMPLYVVVCHISIFIFLTRGEEQWETYTNTKVSVVFVVFSSLIQACCQTACLRCPGWRASSPTSPPSCSTCTCPSPACVRPGRTSSCRWTWDSPSLFRLVNADTSAALGETKNTQMSIFVPRKRTQTPKFRMSFLSFYCGDNRGEQNNLSLVIITYSSGYRLCSVWGF